MEQFFSLLTLQAQLALLMIIGIWFSKKASSTIRVANA